MGMRVDRVELAMERERGSGAEERRACVLCGSWRRSSTYRERSFSFSLFRLLSLLSGKRR